MTVLLWIVGSIVVLFGVVVFRGAPYVPSRQRELRRAFTELYPLKNTDVLIDIGSGDGVVLRAAVAHGAGRAVGLELNPILVLISHWLSRRSRGRIETQLADFWRASFPDDATVVYMFGESRDIIRMMERVTGEATRLGRPLMVISYGFSVPGYEPVKAAGAYWLYQVTPLQRGQA